MRNENRNTTVTNKEVLARMWWGMYSLESNLAVMTGRPSVALEKECSVPPPLPLSTEEIQETFIMRHFGNRHADFETPTRMSLGTGSASPTGGPLPSITALVDEPSNSGSYLKYTVRLGMIAIKSMAEVYAPSTVRSSWEDVQKSISETTEQLEKWVSTLPPGLNFLTPSGQEYEQERTILQLGYYSTKIILSRPCLCRLDRRIQKQSYSSNDFNNRLAGVCVSAAKTVAALLPDESGGDRARIYRMGPWWSMVHIVMQVMLALVNIRYYLLTSSSRSPCFFWNFPMRRLIILKERRICYRHSGSS